LVGVALSVGLMCLSMAALMMATGNMDPVAEVIDKAWEDTALNFRKELEVGNMEVEGEAIDAGVVYCKDMTPAGGSWGTRSSRAARPVTSSAENATRSADGRLGVAEVAL
jgi:hypothetical protein